MSKNINNYKPRLSVDISVHNIDETGEKTSVLLFNKNSEISDDYMKVSSEIMELQHIIDEKLTAVMETYKSVEKDLGEKVKKDGD